MNGIECKISIRTIVHNDIDMDSPKIPEGLQKFLAHAESLHPSGNSKRENGFAKEFQVFYLWQLCLTNIAKCIHSKTTMFSVQMCTVYS